MILSVADHLKQDLPETPVEFTDNLATKNRKLSHGMSHTRWPLKERHGESSKKHNHRTLELQVMGGLNVASKLASKVKHYITHRKSRVKKIATPLIHSSLTNLTNDALIYQTEVDKISKRAVQLENRVKNIKAREDTFRSIQHAEVEDSLKTLHISEAKCEDIQVSTSERLCQINDIKERLERNEKDLGSVESTIVALRTTFLKYQENATSRRSSLTSQRTPLYCSQAVVLPGLDAPYHPSPQSEDFIIPLDGVLLWKISNFAEYLSLAIKKELNFFYSPPFFTDPFGYKLIVKIYLNGHGVTTGSFISVYLCVLEGPYNNILKWPLEERCSITLVNQESARHHTQEFTTQLVTSEFKRPTQEYDKGAGCSYFFPLSKLNNRGFVKDDTAFFKISMRSKNTALDRFTFNRTI